MLQVARICIELLCLCKCTRLVKHILECCRLSNVVYMGRRSSYARRPLRLYTHVPIHVLYVYTKRCHSENEQTSDLFKDLTRSPLLQLTE